MPAKARLGRIRYLNVLPIYFALENVFSENGFELVPGTPAELNARLRRGEVDVSSISAMEYARHPGEYLLLPDLSISSRGPVDSVMLFSRVPWAELDDRPVLVSDNSATGAALVKVLLAELYQARPRFSQGPVAEAGDRGCAAVLAIGDEALRLKAAGVWPHRLDLGAAWQELTGLPQVFGVWAVRRDFAAAQPQASAALHRLLLRSRDWGIQTLPQLSRAAARHSGLPAPQLLAYFEKLDYFLGPEHEQGLLTFCRYLHDLGELPQVPQLAYFGIAK
jgi:chorismate dehydratase